MTSATSPYSNALPFAALPRPSSPQLDTPRFATLGSNTRHDHSSPSRLSNSQIRSATHAEPYRSPAHAANVSAVEQHLRTSLHDPGSELMHRGSSVPMHEHQTHSHARTSQLAYSMLDTQDHSASYSPRGLGALPNSPLGSTLGQHSQYGLRAKSPGPVPSSPLGSLRQKQHSHHSPVTKPYQGLHDPDRSHGLSQMPRHSPQHISHAHVTESSLLNQAYRQQPLAELESLSHTQRHKYSQQPADMDLLSCTQRHTQRQQPTAELDSLSRRLLEQRLGQGRTGYSGLSSHEAMLGRVGEHGQRADSDPVRCVRI